jgi:acetylornithine deacetylase/succinyl-diaminopimelate desuccinylase-like protein
VAVPSTPALSDLPADTDPGLTGRTVELLQALIRTACVNDGTAASGHEHRAVAVLDDALDGLDRLHYEPAPGRRSLLTTVEGTDPDAPTLLLLGHTDVVPVTREAWRHDPFGGEVIDGEVWGRGAVDMLNLTSSMAVAVHHLATRPQRPRATVKYLAVADEEAGGTYGAEWITDHAWADVAADAVLTESGGIPVGGDAIVFATAEKGIGWRRLTIKGTPGHGSMPFRADNALVTAAEVVRRLSAFEPAATLHQHWRAWVHHLDVDDDLRALLLDPARLEEGLALLEPKAARYAHACTHTTFSPNVVRGGTKMNVIPDAVHLDVDIRTLPGIGAAEVDAMLAEALGDLADRVVVSPGDVARAATASVEETEVFDLLRRRAAAVHPGREVLPWMTVGGTDASFFRRRGVPAYGAGMYSAAVPLEEFQSRYHGHDERIDLASLALTTQLWVDLVDGLGG